MLQVVEQDVIIVDRVHPSRAIQLVRGSVHPRHEAVAFRHDVLQHLMIRVRQLQEEGDVCLGDYFLGPTQEVD